jgi:ABC-type lipoprotein export system ATPase subunit
MEHDCCGGVRSAVARNDLLPCPESNLEQSRPLLVVPTFAELIHKQDRAGIMVTHDLRMCNYVDRVIQMTDGRVSREIVDGNEIQRLAVAAVAMDGFGQAHDSQAVPTREPSLAYGL